jgi:curved DNA-binding protein CbpA
MATTRDYYRILGVPPTASADDIKKAYRTLSKKYHPDLNPDLKRFSDDKMKELVEAYNVLNEAGKRKEYDKQPQFQIRRFRKGVGKLGGSTGAAAYMKKPEYSREPSLLEKISSFFIKKDKGPSGGPSQPDPKQAEVYFTLGLSMADNDSFLDQAKNNFQLAIKFDPEHKEAHYNLGLMCYKRGEFEEATIHFQKVLNVDKEDQLARKMITMLRDE